MHNSTPVVIPVQLSRITAPERQFYFNNLGKATDVIYIFACLSLQFEQFHLHLYSKCIILNTKHNKTTVFQSTRLYINSCCGSGDARWAVPLFPLIITSHTCRKKLCVLKFTGETEPCISLSPVIFE